MVLSCVVCCVLGGVRSPRDVTVAGNQKVALVSTSAEILDSLTGGLIENEWEMCFATALLMSRGATGNRVLHFRADTVNL